MAKNGEVTSVSESNLIPINIIAPMLHYVYYFALVPLVGAGERNRDAITNFESWWVIYEGLPTL